MLREMATTRKVRRSFLVLVGVLACVPCDGDVYTAPMPTIEALSKGGFRVYIPALDDIKRFTFNANINEDLPRTKSGKVFKETTTTTDGVLMLQFDNVLNVGDTLNYRIQVDKGSLGYRREGLSWTVTKADLRDEYPQVGGPCKVAFTTVNDRNTCVGRLILSEEFIGPSVDTNKWIIEHMIPTYSAPNYEFNSYENIDKTRFIKDGILYLKPHALMNDYEVRSTLDLRSGCTSDVAIQCFHKQRGAFYIPPVKSGRITSKISFKYGRVEIRAKLPAGEWLFPVIELQTKDKSLGPDSPKVLMAYSRGNEHLYNTEKDEIGSHVLYAGPVLVHNEPERSRRLKKRVDTVPFYNSFHVYKMEWVPGKMSFYIDSNLYAEVSTTTDVSEHQRFASGFEAPFDVEYVLSLGVGVGGINDFPQGYVSGGHNKPWDDVERTPVKSFFDGRSEWSTTWMGDNTALQIDYVRIWAV